MILWTGRKDGAAALRLHGLCAGAEGSFADLTVNVPEAEITKKESHRTVKLFSRRTDNGFHNSRQVVRNTYGLKDTTKWMSQFVIPY